MVDFLFTTCKEIILFRSAILTSLALSCIRLYICVWFDTNILTLSHLWECLTLCTYSISQMYVHWTHVFFCITTLTSIFCICWSTIYNPWNNLSFSREHVSSLSFSLSPSFSLLVVYPSTWHRVWHTEKLNKYLMDRRILSQKITFLLFFIL